MHHHYFFPLQSSVFLGNGLNVNACSQTLLDMGGLRSELLLMKRFVYLTKGEFLNIKLSFDGYPHRYGWSEVRTPINEKVCISHKRRILKYQTFF